MEPEAFEDLKMILLIGGLVLFMAFIWDLAKKSEASRFGTLILFFALALACLVF